MAGHEVLDEPVWRARASAHRERMRRWTGPHRERRRRGEAHPVVDFLFTYYSHRPAQLRRWHPGPGQVLEDAADLPRAGWRHYRRRRDAVELDTAAFREARAGTLDFVRRLLTTTRDRPAQLGCFGMHEWAMVYRLGEDELRHRDWPLRLGGAATDEVVDAAQVRCSHYDAYRFYTPPARSLNLLTPTRESQVDLEQPGCLHAGMDLYKWATTLAPAIPSELVMDCFDHARAIRELDMRASPYDLRALGYEPVPVETAAGRAAYVAAQRSFAEAGQALRDRLLEALDAVESDAGVTVRSGAGRQVGPAARRGGEP